MSLWKGALGLVVASGMAGMGFMTYQMERRVTQLEALVEAGAGRPATARAGRPGRARDLDPSGMEARASPPRGPMVRPRRPLAGGGPPPDELDPGLEAQVRGVIQEEREASEQQQRAQFRAMFTERMNARLDTFATDFDVPAQTRDALGELLTAEIDRSMELRNQIRSGERPFSEVRDELQALREETSTRAGEMLDEAQLEAFESFHRRRGRPPGGGAPPF